MSEAWRFLQTAIRAVGIDDLTPTRAEEVGVCNLVVEAAPGDHVAVRRSPDVAWHHGIFVCGGRDAAVIDNTPDGGIRQRSLAFFTDKAMQAVIVRYDGDSATLLSFSHLSSRVVACVQPAAIYDVIGFNCESFATWCRTGRCASSFQIDVPWTAAPIKNVLCALQVPVRAGPKSV